jgi:hypothetical protein
MRILSPKTHGYLDYMAFLLLLLAPAVFGFTSPTAIRLSNTLGWGYLVFSLLTSYPLGLIKWIPFPVHGAIELLTSLALVAFPWMLGFSADGAARNFFVSAGVALFVLWAVTDYRGTRTRARLQQPPITQERPKSRI